jgi:hypothetical protein
MNGWFCSTTIIRHQQQSVELLANSGDAILILAVCEGAMGGRHGIPQRPGCAQWRTMASPFFASSATKANAYWPHYSDPARAVKVLGSGWGYRPASRRQLQHPPPHGSEPIESPTPMPLLAGDGHTVVGDRPPPIFTKTCANGNRLSGRPERRLNSDKDRHQYPILSPRPKPSPIEIPGWP